jgi:ATP-dependent DNA helicase RecQ
MNKYQKILFEYWGYPEFRDLQEDIITSVADRRLDTLALMPTGGGKSITFQVPALAMDGICLVITPLIALMKDQVENLRKKGVKALMIHSGMTAREIDITLDNAVFGNYKFLYLSPERLQTELFRVRLQKMNVCLLAVDESHCISQWGYDFRPSYLQIAEIRKFVPDAPVLALTATATPEVADDIMAKLEFAKPHLLKKSFERKNLVYLVRRAEDKFEYLLRVLNRESGTAIVYVRNRGATREVAQKLLQSGISADFYHAGLSTEMRNLRQDEWKSGKTRVIVATNAFGMGIDKPDVRVVVHLDLPDSIEAYFQEAGRAGRDGKTSYALLLYSPADRAKFERRYQSEFPDIEKIKSIYQSACNFLQVPYGGGKGASYSFDLGLFSYHCKYYPAMVINAFKFLQRENIAELTDEVHNPSRVTFIVSRDDLYSVQIKNPDIDRFIRGFLRIYTGLFSDYVNIDEGFVAKVLSMTRDEVYQMFMHLRRMRIVDFIPQRKSAMLILHEERRESKSIRISPANYAWMKKRFVARMESMLAYSETDERCRSVQLIAYFGEKIGNCGQCDVCRRRNELNLTRYEFDLIVEKIKTRLSESAATVGELAGLSDTPETLIKTVRWLQDNGKISCENNRFRWL